ncbi:MAG: hypothetical protein ACP5T2_06645 [Thermoprotei archaeon]
MASPSGEASPSSPSIGPSFNYTGKALLLYNNTLLKGSVVTSPFLSDPVALVYDPSNNEIYVVNAFPDTLLKSV